MPPGPRPGAPAPAGGLAQKKTFRQSLGGYGRHVGGNVHDPLLMLVTRQGLVHVLQKVERSDDIVFENNGAAVIAYGGAHPVGNGVGQSKIAFSLMHGHRGKSGGASGKRAHRVHCRLVLVVPGRVGINDKRGPRGQGVGGKSRQSPPGVLRAVVCEQDHRGASYCCRRHAEINSCRTFRMRASS